MYLSNFFPALLAVGLGVSSPIVDERNTPCPTGISPEASAAVVYKFEKSRIVPDLIPSIKPKVEVDVAYGSKEVLLGNNFTTLETVSPPTLNFTAEPGYDAAKTNYSYFLIDPDVPSPEGAAGIKVTFLHWQVAHAQPVCITKQNTETVTIYEPLTPASTTEHRYTFLVFREPPNYSPDLVASQVRPGFDINTYAAKAGLKLVGGNYLLEAITNTD